MMQLYDRTNLPATIGTAIYSYGDNHIKDIVLYGENDPEHGFILTPDALYYSFSNKGSLNLNALSKISIQKPHKQERRLILTADQTNHIFTDHDFDLDDLLEDLLDLTDVGVTYDMNVYDQIAYLSSMILNDIKNDMYEDIELTPIQEEQLTNYLDSVHRSDAMDENNYRMEMELLVDHVVDLCHDLALESDDVTALEKAQAQMNETENQMFDQFQDMYANRKDQIKDITGIDMDDLQNKTPEELNQMVDDLCARFNISKDQLTELAARFNKKQNGM